MVLRETFGAYYGDTGLVLVEEHRRCHFLTWPPWLLNTPQFTDKCISLFSAVETCEA
jgi:hypothetical protein